MVSLNAARVLKLSHGNRIALVYPLADRDTERGFQLI